MVHIPKISMVAGISHKEKWLSLIKALMNQNFVFAGNLKVTSHLTQRSVWTFSATLGMYPKRQKWSILSELPDFSWYNLPKREKYTKWPQKPQTIPNDRKPDQMSIKCNHIFYCMTFQNLPKVGFLVWK
jgi:hypothetical protein